MKNESPAGEVQLPPGRGRRSHIHVLPRESLDSERKQCPVPTSARAVRGIPPHRKAGPRRPTGSSSCSSSHSSSSSSRCDTRQVFWEASEAECGLQRYPQSWAPAGPHRPVVQLRCDSGCDFALRLRLECRSVLRCAAGRQGALCVLNAVVNSACMTVVGVLTVDLFCKFAPNLGQFANPTKFTIPYFTLFPNMIFPKQCLHLGVLTCTQ